MKKFEKSNDIGFSPFLRIFSIEKTMTAYYNEIGKATDRKTILAAEK